MIFGLALLMLMVWIGFKNILRGIAAGLLTWFIVWLAFYWFSPTVCSENDEFCYGYIPAIAGVIVGIAGTIALKMKLHEKMDEWDEKMDEAERRRNEKEQQETG